jgi:predicted metal-dependent hydrolase
MSGHCQTEVCRLILNRKRGDVYILAYGGYEIPFRVNQSDRSKLTLHVYPDMRLEVLAPSNKPLERILGGVDRRAKWIVKQWRYFEQHQPKQPERRFVGGETHLYLGRQYRLKVANASVSDVKLIGRYFRVQHSEPGDSLAISGLLQEWYVRHATALFTARVEHWVSECRALSLPERPTLLVRPMTRRWGSCSKKGTITLNVDLVKVPLIYIDYVIVHELCHLRILNHSPAFYRLLTRCMPDWRQRKERLDGLVV